MKIRLITVVPIVVLLAVVLFLTPSSDVLAASTTCNSCADCNSKLASGSWDTVTLTTDISNHEGGCIGLLLSESNVVFDCDGHTIDGDDIAIDPEAGIAMMHGTGNTIRNCTVSDFSQGIYLWDATSHVITNNTLTSNGTGIELGWSDSNDINNNTITGNYNGIVISNSNSNAIDANTVCQSENLDFSLASGTGNSGDNNTCDSPDGWNDDGTTGCTNGCTGTATCNSCSDCSSKLDGTFDKVLLTQDISNHAGTCITFGASNVEFDGDNHQIDGDDIAIDPDYGIYMNGKSGNTVKNCDVTDFQYGIYLTGSSGNTVSRNTANSNINDGIYLNNSSGNTIAVFNEANSNGGNGIYLASSNNNDVYFNDANSNNNVGIRLDGSDSNTITFNDVLDNDSTNAWGIYMYSSDSNTISSNNVVGNYYGIKFDNSNSNTLNSNEVCSNPDVDFDLVGGSAGNSGDNNTCCASPATWNDTGATGCTYACDTEPDANDNGISDACDCADARQGLNETGIDCGGTCPACLAVPSGWSNVTEVRLRGAPNSGFIDVVFVPEQSYSGNMAAFNAAVTDNIAEWFLRLEDLTDESLPANYRDRFNFYTYTGGFGTLSGCAGTLPSNFWSDAPGTDLGAILSPASAGGWGCTNGFGPPGGNIHLTAVAEREGQVMHEVGHGIFGLVDQYCSDSTSYTQATPATNVWSSFSNCQTDASAQGWTEGSCTQIASGSCSKSYWKYDTASLMDGSSFLCTSGNVCTHSTDAFKEATMWRMNWVFDNWPAGHSKGVLTHFNINQGVITELSSEIVAGHPDVGLQPEDFRVQLRSGDDQVLQQYGIGDPRIELWDDRRALYVDNVDFFVTFPYEAGVQRAEIRDPETEELKVSVDFSALDCTCNSCSDCEEKLRDPACLTVRLTEDIIDYAGTCIGLILGESDADFDCDGHTIDGDDIAIDPDHGVTMMHGTNNSVRNCVISDFSNGIYLWDATAHVLKGNTLTSNDEGIEIGWSDDNYLINNTVSENYNGITMSNSNTNSVRSNVVCQNTNLDFNLASGTGNSGDDNWCDNPDGWNDDGTTGCSTPCTGTSLYISPTVSTVGISDTVTVDVMVDSIEDLYGVQLYLSFDPQIVQVEDAIPGGDVNIEPGDFLQPGAVTVANIVNNSTGEIEYVQTRQGAVPGVSGSGVLARIVFHGRAAGTSPLAFTLHVLGDPQSVPIAHGTEDGEINVRVQTGSVEGRVILERRVNYPNANAGVAVRLAGQLQVTGDDGTYSFSDVPEGTHEISVTHPSYLPTWRNVEVTAGATTPLPDVTMLGGDCGASVPQGYIYAHDGNDILMAWDSEPGDARWNPRVDIRDDQVINVLDLTAVQFNWRRSAPGPWPGSAAAAQGAAWRLREPSLAPQTTAQTTIVVSPTLAATNVGLPTTVEIWVQDVEALNVGAFLLDFDPSVVQVQDANPFQDGVQIESGSWLELQVEMANSVDNAAGEVDFGVGQHYPATGKDGSGILARITFVGVAEGISALEFSQVELVNDEGSIIPASAQDGEVVVRSGFSLYLPIVLRDSG